MTRFIAILLSMLLVVLPTVADEVEALDSILQLETVAVVAKHKPYQAVIPSQTLSGKELQQLNAHSVADAIRYFAGVQLKDYGGVGGIKTLDIRSMGTNHMGVFYDGIQLGNAQNGQIDLGKYSLDNIESIQLYNGQKSEIFQSAKDFGSAGTVYITTRRPRFEEGKRYNLRVMMKTGSFGLANPSALWEYKLSQRVSLSANVEYTYATGRYKFRYRKIFSDGTLAWDTTAVRQNGDVYALRAEAGLFGSINGGQWNVKAYFYDSERGIPGAIVNNVWKNAQRQWDRNLFAQGSLRKRFSSRYVMMLNAKYARDYMHYNNPDTTLMYIDNEFWQQEVYVSAANKFSIFQNWDVNMSVDYQWNTLDANLTQFVYPTRHTALAALATAFTYGGFKAQASVLGTFVSDRSKIMNAGNMLGYRTKHFDKFTPAVFVAYQPFEHHDFDVRAFYKRIFRMPTFNDLYYTDIGNADLRPEYASQYDVGARYTCHMADGVLRSINVSADAYYNYVTDKIIAVPKGTGQYRWMMMNIGKVKIRGVDATARAEFALPYGIGLNTQLNYTYQRAQDYTDPTDNADEAGTYKGQIAYIPRHSGSVIVGGEWQRLKLNYSFIYVGERYHNSSNIAANYEQPWYTHDISGSYEMKLGTTLVKATLEVNNLLNQQYEVICNYPMPGRNFKVILSFEI
ncbi:MAG: TonB-dependent receptor [Muribaculaceae bacterium]|nr:TonB-dependent receptor [Muribaculaceae bacterium]